MSEPSEHAKALGSIRTEKKSESSRANISIARQRLQDPDVRALLSQKQKERRERERQEKEASAALSPPEVTEKKRPGRPKKQSADSADTTQEKRGRGRPKKQEEQLDNQIVNAEKQEEADAL